MQKKSARGGGKKVHDTQIWFWYFHAPSEKCNPRRTVPPNASVIPLDLDSGLQGLLALLDALLGLVSHDTTTPLLASVLVLLQVSILDGGHKLGKLVLVLGADLGEGEDGRGLDVGKHMYGNSAAW